MNFQRPTFAIALFTTALTTQFAHAVMLTHSVDGVLFNETFESQTVGSAPTAANIFPGGANQAWYAVTAGSPNPMQPVSTVLTRNASSDALLDAYQGSQYVQINRPDNQSIVLIGDFGSQNYTTGVLTLKFAAYLPGPLNPSSGAAGFILRLDSQSGNALAGTLDIGFDIRTQPNGAINYVPSSGTSTATGLTWTPAKWQVWTINYNLGNDTFSLSVDQNSVSNLTAWHHVAISRFTYQAVNFQSGAFYLDAIPVVAVPEPSGFALLAVGVVGACLSRSRRRDR